MKEENDTSFAACVKKKVKKQFELINVDPKDYYQHPTYCISNLAEYISLISLVSSASDSLTQGDTIVYRGMSDKQYKMKPGLARIKNLNIDTENELISDFLTRRPDAFKDLNDFDILAKMQHYRLPTRLLDFSLNPLVALYFACESSPRKPGRVLCHLSFLQNDKDEHVKAISNAVVNKSFDDNLTVDAYLCNQELPLLKYLREFYLYSQTSVIRPKYWNQRISNQAGVFMLFPNNLLDKYLGIIKHIDQLGLEDAIKEYGRGNIDRDILKSILENENVNFYKQEEETYLTERYFIEIIKSYSDDKKDLLLNNISNRFIIKKSIKHLSDEIIADQFCSIIVEGKNKKKILRELSYIGIGVDYIYPELEYTVQEIENHFNIEWDTEID